TRQSRAARKLPSESRIILTGTPVENHLGDLWSLFDFINPGLLGSAKAFTAWTRGLRDAPDGYAPLRRLVQPYLLRRLKTDKGVIADLPDKVEQLVWCPLSREQGALYQRAVEELRAELDNVDGMKRRGLVLAYLLRFKQICNHPSQWLNDAVWQPEHSGKFARLDELCDTIAERQEKVLVFTQFRETTEPLAAHLARRFGREGLVLTGATPVGRRRQLVRRFQDDDGPPFFVISLKAGGSGLNLTAANHVIHFDRWWNPAVENQATDRAFRIGQHRNVLVHKFTCRGTIEERIARMIADWPRPAA
ncbi:MAG: DEAD/DEAH box helicase, partial [Planctomycetota bacterium]